MFAWGCAETPGVHELASLSPGFAGPGGMAMRWHEVASLQDMADVDVTIFS